MFNYFVRSVFHSTRLGLPRPQYRQHAAAGDPGQYRSRGSGPEAVLAQDPHGAGLWHSLLKLIDDCNREWLVIEVDFSLPAEWVIRTLNQIVEWRGCQATIRCDNVLRTGIHQCLA